MTSSIRVRYFACLGFLEAADVLCGDAEGGFDWSDEADVRFCLRAAGNSSPFEVVLGFLANTEPRRWGPGDYSEPPSKTREKDKMAEENKLELRDTFPAHKASATKMALPICLGGESRSAIEISHWADGSGRNAFKLYSGNRSALTIATAMIKGIDQLCEEQWNNLIERPFEVLLPMGGSFNFDPRGGWTALDVGYSPNEQEHQVTASPVVEFLAAWGLENARPDEYKKRKVRYAVWGVPLPPMLARAALCGGTAAIPV